MDTQNDSLEKEIWPFFGIYMYFKPFTDLLCQDDRKKKKWKEKHIPLPYMVMFIKHKVFMSHVTFKRGKPRTKYMKQKTITNQQNKHILYSTWYPKQPSFFPDVWWNHPCDNFWSHPASGHQVSYEKNPPILSMKYWLFKRDPYIGLLQFLYNWVGFHPLKKTVTNQVFFSLLRHIRKDSHQPSCLRRRFVWRLCRCLVGLNVVFNVGHGTSNFRIPGWNFNRILSNNL